MLDQSGPVGNGHECGHMSPTNRNDSRMASQVMHRGAGLTKDEC